MNDRSKLLRGLKAFLFATVLFLLALGWFRYFYLRIHVALAEEQAWYFQQASEKVTRGGETNKAAEYVEAIKNYYPSGSKQDVGTDLDRMVERSRAFAIELIEQKATASTNTTAK